MNRLFISLVLVLSMTFSVEAAAARPSSTLETRNTTGQLISQVRVGEDFFLFSIVRHAYDEENTLILYTLDFPSYFQVLNVGDNRCIAEIVLGFTRVQCGFTTTQNVIQLKLRLVRIPGCHEIPQTEHFFVGRSNPEGFHTGANLSLIGNNYCSFLPQVSY